MSELPIAALNVTGSDAFKFLQSQLTTDIAALETEAEVLSAWCNPKGRVIWFGTLQAIESGYALSVPTDLADDMVQRLTIFRFRSKVDFTVENTGATVDASFLVKNGFPFIGRAQTEQFTPHMLNLDLLNAASVDKGCYPGQEIVARTHFRGKTKRRCLRFESDAPLSAGDKVSDGDREIGEVLNTSGDDLLAVVPIDRIQNELHVNGVEIQNIPLPYM